MATSTVDANRVIVTGENPFIRLSATDGGPNRTDASYWRIVFSPAGPGHVLYINSELTEDQWRIYSDNIAMTRWLQGSVQGMPNEELADQSIPVLDADFHKHGDLRSFWTETIVSHEDEIAMTWHDLGKPLLVHTTPGDKPYGVCTVLIPAKGARLAINGRQASGQPWPPRAGRAPIQHLRVGIFRELDRIKPSRLAVPEIGRIMIGTDCPATRAQASDPWSVRRAWQ